MEVRYDELIDGIELLDIYLGSAQFKRHALPDPDKYPEVKASVTTGKSSYRECDGELCIDQEIRFLLEQVSEDRGKTRKIFSLKGVFTLVYQIASPMDDETFELFKKRNIPVNLHPYIRELIQSLMTRAGLPSFILPALKIKR
jgi:preprotein translocase subunit SecB